MGHDQLRLRLALLFQEKGPYHLQTRTMPSPFLDLQPVATTVEVSEGSSPLRRQRRGGARLMAPLPAVEGLRLCASKENSLLTLIRSVQRTSQPKDFSSPDAQELSCYT
ncbi:uncharacterized protein HKW66_Vig0245560 [Vigna angularis]|uniref:Uncharacterized protein n=1 Tax=Phaseolus angularis TaxID=3914 RepID=A0A8T0KCC0_PHAAN|nr:uncharacterized protein HKW66_Vig0245560 [Vigna angularis]